MGTRVSLFASPFIHRPDGPRSSSGNTHKSRVPCILNRVDVGACKAVPRDSNLTHNLFYSTARENVPMYLRCAFLTLSAERDCSPTWPGRTQEMIDYVKRFQILLLPHDVSHGYFFRISLLSRTSTILDTFQEANFCTLVRVH